MRVILLTGGTGFVGRHLRPTLRTNPVVLLGRKKPVLLDNEQWSYMDMAEPIAPEELAQGEVLCHLAFAMEEGRKNVTYNRHLLDAVNICPSIRQVVLMSSVSVYGEPTPSVIDEETSCTPFGEYAETKLACEKLWWEELREDCLLTVLRPSSVIGPGGIGLRLLIRDSLHRPIVGVAKRSVIYHRPPHFVAVSNVVAAVIFCLRHPQISSREVYVVSDDHQPENKSYAAMQDLVRDISGRNPLPGIPLPRWMVRVLKAITGRPRDSKGIFSSQKIHDRGFEDAVSLRAEVRRVLQSTEGFTSENVTSEVGDR